MERLVSGARRRVLLPLTDLLRFRRDVTPLMREIEEREHWEPARLRRWQVDQLRPFLRHCQENVPFYARRFAEVGFDAARFEDLVELEKIPPLTKDDIRANITDLFARGSSVKTTKLGLTGGSTGVPTPFYQSHEEQAWVEAATRRCRQIEGFLPTARVVALGGRSYRDPTWKSRLALHYKRHVRNVLSLPSPFLTEALLDQYSAAIDEFLPEIVYGYPSALFVLARYMVPRGKRFPSVRVIETGSEKLFDHQRALIREAFGIEPFDGYGGGDCPVAWECPAHQGLHVLQNSGVIEFVDAEGRAVKPGTVGRVLVTRFTNLAWPYVRYDMDDLAEPMDDAPCPCGSHLPRVASVVGRAGDLVETPDGRSITAANVTLVFGPMHDRVYAYQIVQEALDRITVMLVRTDAYTEKDEATIRGHLTSFLGTAVNLEFRYVNEIAKTQAGKHLVLLSRLPLRGDR